MRERIRYSASRVCQDVERILGLLPQNHESRPALLAALAECRALLAEGRG